MSRTITSSRIRRALGKGALSVLALSLLVTQTGCPGLGGIFAPFCGFIPLGPAFCPLGVSITAPSGTINAGDTFTLSAAVTGGFGALSFNWTGSGPGTVNFVNGSTSNPVNVTCSNPGTYTFSVTASDSSNLPLFPPKTASAMVNVTISPTPAPPPPPPPPGTLVVNAGADQTCFFCFGAGVVFGPTPVPPAVGCGGLAAVATDPAFPMGGIAFAWQFLSGPAGVTASDVIIANSSAAATGFTAVPKLSDTPIRLIGTGLTNTTTGNTLPPGAYTFRCTATSPNGTSQSDDVTINIEPAFTIPAGGMPPIPPAPPCGVPLGGSLSGLALANGQLSNRTILPNSITVPYTALTTLAGTLQFILTDTSGAADAQAAANLNSVALAPMTPPATQALNANVSGATRGTYTVNASFQAGLASVASTPTGLTAHVQPALPSAIDVRVPMAGTSAVNTFGLVNSTSVAATPIVNVHGARETDGGPGYTGTAVICCDINGDGVQEIIAGTGTAISIYHGVTADPTVNTNSPRPNVINNDGTLTVAGGLVDSFTHPGANVTALLCCDIDNDGRPDLIVGDGTFDAAGMAGSEGRVFIYYHGGFNGFAQNPYNIGGAGALVGGGALAASAAFTRSDDATDENFFGYSLACGDWSGDGIADLVVGAPNDGGDTGTASGAVYGIVGSAARYAGVTTIVDAGGGAAFRLIPTTPAAVAADMNGAAVGVAQIDGSGPLDVVYGAPGFSTGMSAEAGRVNVAFGGGALTGNIGIVSRTWEGNAAFLGLGRRINTCNFRGGTTVSVIVSAEANSAGTHVIATSAGRIFTIPSTQGTILDDGNTTLAGLPQISGAAADSNLGACLACGDYNNDGFADVLATAASPTAANQRILLINGSATPPAALTAGTTFSNGAGAAFLTTPADGVFTGALGFTASIFVADGCSLECDVNGDNISDLFWQGLLGGPTEAAFIAGAE